MSIQGGRAFFAHSFVLHAAKWRPAGASCRTAQKLLVAGLCCSVGEGFAVGIDGIVRVLQRGLDNLVGATKG